MEPAQSSAELSPQKQAWVDFCATNGMSVDEEGNPRKVSAETLAKELGVARRTLYEWRDQIPNFWDLVIARRKEIYARSRMSRVYNAVFAKAMKGDIPAATLLMKQAGIMEADKVINTVTVDAIATLE